MAPKRRYELKENEMTYTETLTLKTESCITCGITFAVPLDFQMSCRRDTKKEFFCPNGHSMVYRTSIYQQEIDKLKREKDEAERGKEALHNQLTEKQNEISKLQSSIKRRNKRTAAGICPCCNRTFKQLAEHMKTKHPEVAPASESNPLHKKISSK